MKHAAALVTSLVLLFLASSLFGLENPISPNAEILPIESVTLPFLNQVDQAARPFSGPAAVAGWYGYGTCYLVGEDGYYPVWATFTECCGDYGGYEWIGNGGDYLCERDYTP